MVYVSVDEIRRDLQGYIQRVEAGETLVILNDNTPVAEVKPIALASTSVRPFGLCAGEFLVPDNFDEPLPQEILSQFEGK